MMGARSLEGVVARFNRFEPVAFELISGCLRFCVQDSTLSVRREESSSTWRGYFELQRLVISDVFHPRAVSNAFQIRL